ncbi:glycosyltransferase family 4 protein [Nonlabens xiamenensis]|uniref:glycosyltransferase family 4 protein n=1 Tax=Nonlabens xiamenensis TaxID=2341043 RepID=UPI000F606E4A|nr:glycosyltransferase family 4 protein [Nonlabens xiamenensis]
MSKILILGPISEFGGRESMTRFLYQIFDDLYKVSIFSTTVVSDQSIAFEKVPAQNFTSIGKEITKRYPLISLTGYLVKKYHSRKPPHYFFLKNGLTRSLVDFDKIYRKIIIDITKDFDLLFYSGEICDKWISLLSAQTSSKKQLFIRVTGMVKVKQISKTLSKDIHFIVHSPENFDALRTQGFEKVTYIEQSTRLEQQLLNLPLQHKDPPVYGYVGRLSSEKGILELLEAAYQLKLPLKIAGDGPLIDQVKAFVSKYDQFEYKGNLDDDGLVQFYQETDVNIISSFHEGGPIVGVEMMAAGNLIISTKVGAMEKRLSNTKNQFFLEHQALKESLKNNVQKINELSSKEHTALKQELRNTYLENSSIASVRRAFLETIKNNS